MADAEEGWIQRRGGQGRRRATEQWQAWRRDHPPRRVRVPGRGGRLRLHHRPRQPWPGVREPAGLLLNAETPWAGRRTAQQPSHDHLSYRAENCNPCPPGSGRDSLDHPSPGTPRVYPHAPATSSAHQRACYPTVRGRNLQFVPSSLSIDPRGVAGHTVPATCAASQIIRRRDW